jgi:hypothetical protein
MNEENTLSDMSLRTGTGWRSERQRGHRDTRHTTLPACLGYGPSLPSGAV